MGGAVSLVSLLVVGAPVLVGAADVLLTESVTPGPLVVLGVVPVSPLLLSPQAARTRTRCNGELQRIGRAWLNFAAGEPAPRLAPSAASPIDPISVIVVGYDQHDSHGYLGGTGTKIINPDPQ